MRGSSVVSLVRESTQSRTGQIGNGGEAWNPPLSCIIHLGLSDRRASGIDLPFLALERLWLEVVDTYRGC